MTEARRHLNKQRSTESGKAAFQPQACPPPHPWVPEGSAQNPYVPVAQVVRPAPQATDGSEIVLTGLKYVRWGVMVVAVLMMCMGTVVVATGGPGFVLLPSLGFLVLWFILGLVRTIVERLVSNDRKP